VPEEVTMKALDQLVLVQVEVELAVIESLFLTLQ
jgi:hypothetical protein